MSVGDVNCPNCGIKFPVVAGMNDADARRVSALMANIPNTVAPLLLEYLALFKPPKSGITWSRAYKVLAEVCACVATGQVMRKGRVWKTTDEHWSQALQQVIDRRDKFTLPLKTHGYLFEIVVGLADKTEADQERNTEKRRQQGSVLPEVNNGRTRQVIESEIRHFEKLMQNLDGKQKENMQGIIDKLKLELAQFDE